MLFRGIVFGIIIEIIIILLVLLGLKGYHIVSDNNITYKEYKSSLVQSEDDFDATEWVIDYYSNLKD